MPILKTWRGIIFGHFSTFCKLSYACAKSGTFLTKLLKVKAYIFAIFFRSPYDSHQFLNIDQFFLRNNSAGFAYLWWRRYLWKKSYVLYYEMSFGPYTIVLIRETRGMGPADCWNWGEWELKEYKWKGSFLGCSVRLVVPVQEIFVLPWLH